MRILYVPGDFGGCGYFRLTQWAQHFMLEPRLGIEPCYAGVNNLVYMDQDVTVVQRVCGENALKALIEFREKHPSKVVIDFDDLLWNEKGTLNDYNIALKGENLQKNQAMLKKYLPDAADLITVSTEALAKELELFVPPERIKVIPNYLSMREWLYDKTTMIPNDDIFLYAGSSSHYDNSEKKLGDFSIPLSKLLERKPTIFIGNNPPWFFGNCKLSVPWAGLSRYSKVLYDAARNAKFTIAPLSESRFNRCKSDLKYLESCAVGRVCLVGDFECSPYGGAHPMQKLPQNASIGEIEAIVENCKEHYGEILEYQYDYLNNRWLDLNVSNYVETMANVI